MKIFDSLVHNEYMWHMIKWISYAKHTFTLLFFLAILWIPSEGSGGAGGGGGGGGGGATASIGVIEVTPRPPVPLMLTVSEFRSLRGAPAAAPPPRASMAMSPSGCLRKRMVPCCSISSSRFSMLLCLWKAASFSWIIRRSVCTCVLADSYVSWITMGRKEEQSRVKDVGVHTTCNFPPKIL